MNLLSYDETFTVLKWIERSKESTTLIPSKILFSIKFLLVTILLRTILQIVIKHFSIQSTCTNIITTLTLTRHCVEL